MESSISSKKWTKTRCIVVKMNSFVHFLEEFMAWQLAFEINWPLAWAFSSVLSSNSALKVLHKRKHFSFYKILCQLGVFMTIYIKCIILCCVCTIQSRPKLVDQNSPIAMLWAKYVDSWVQLLLWSEFCSHSWRI